MKPVTRAALLLVFLLSGATALAYQVVYARQLLLLFGSTTYATSAVLAGFLAGLGLGALAIGRWVDRSRKPLQLYAALELGVGVFAILFPFTLALLEPLYAAIYPRLEGHFLALSLVRFAAAFVLLLPATALMGATLPTLVRVLHRDGNIGRDLGILYAVNTLGGVVGTLAAAFVLIRLLGMRGTLLACAAVNVAIAVTAWLVSRRLPAIEPARPTPAVEVTASAPGRRGLLAIFAISGFAALTLEVAWTRALVFVVGTSTYSFSLMLATFLLGIVFGSILYSRLLDRVRAPLMVLGVCELALATLTLLSLPLLAWAANGASLMRFPAIAVPGDGLLWLGKAGLVSLGVMLPPTILFGIIFPLVVSILAGRRDAVGREVGLGYAVNTIGAILGAFTAGFVLIPSLGVRGTTAAAASLCLLAGLGALVLAGGPRRPRIALAVAGLVTAVATLTLLARDPFLEGIVKRRPGKLVFFREGRDGSVAVFEERPDAYDRQMLVNGTPYAGTMAFARRYMKFLAHLPTLLVHAPREALVICFGTGTTFGAALAHPELERVDCVDLNREVLAAAPLFAEVNHGAATNPRGRVVIGDGRNHVLLTDRTYDVITFEPPPPAEAGAVNLYSRDFYEICLTKLRPGGVVAQWLPLDDQSENSSRALIRSFLDAFPAVSLWLPVEEEAILIGSREPLTVDLSELTRRMSAASVRESLLDVGVDSPAKLLRTFLLDRTALEAYAGSVPAVTDNHPTAEFWSFFEPNIGLRTTANLLDRARPIEALAGVSPDDALTAEVTAHRLFLRGALTRQTDPEGTLDTWIQSMRLAPDDYLLMRLNRSPRDHERRMRRLREMFAEKGRDAKDRAAILASAGWEQLRMDAPHEATESFAGALKLDSENAHAKRGAAALEQLERDGSR